MIHARKVLSECLTNQCLAISYQTPGPEWCKYTCMCRRPCHHLHWNTVLRRRPGGSSCNGKHKTLTKITFLQLYNKHSSLPREIALQLPITHEPRDPQLHFANPSWRQLAVKEAESVDHDQHPRMESTTIEANEASQDISPRCVK
jgi:hypothetical protein